MSRHVVSTSPDNLTGVFWPVPNENLKQSSRALRSSKPEVHYRFQDPVPLRKHISEPSGVTRTPSAPTLPLITTQPQSADRFLVGPPTPQPPYLEEDVFIYEVQNLPPFNLDNFDVDNETNFIDTMAEDRTLLPTPFAATPEEDPAEFLRRLETYMDFKNHNEESRIRLARAMMVSASADWLQALPTEKKDTYAHLKAAFEEKYIQPSILKFRSAREIFGKKQTINESVDTYSNRLRNLGRKTMQH